MLLTHKSGIEPVVTMLPGLCDSVTVCTYLGWKLSENI